MVEGREGQYGQSPQRRDASTCTRCFFTKVSTQFRHDTILLACNMLTVPNIDGSALCGEDTLLQFYYRNAIDPTVNPLKVGGGGLV